MPSPIAHSLVSGIIFFLSSKRLGFSWKPIATIARNLFFFIIYSNILDLDFIPGIITGGLNRFHHGISHSIGFSIIFAFFTGLLARFIFKKSFFGVGTICFTLLLVHLFMDFFTGDTSFPYGVMLFWPFSNRYYISPISIFPAFAKREVVIDILSPLNIRGYLYEILLCLPIFIILGIYRIKKAINNKG